MSTSHPHREAADNSHQGDGGFTDLEAVLREDESAGEAKGKELVRPVTHLEGGQIIPTPEHALPPMMEELGRFVQEMNVEMPPESALFRRTKRWLFAERDQVRAVGANAYVRYNAARQLFPEVTVIDNRYRNIYGPELECLEIADFEVHNPDGPDISGFEALLGDFAEAAHLNNPWDATVIDELALPGSSEWTQAHGWFPVFDSEFDEYEEQPRRKQPRTYFKLTTKGLNKVRDVVDPGPDDPFSSYEAYMRMFRDTFAQRFGQSYEDFEAGVQPSDAPGTDIAPRSNNQ